MQRQELAERVRAVLAEARLVSRGDRVLVGVSGGADSVALLHLLAALRPLLGIDLIIGHVDHQLRVDSARDAEEVATLAKRLGVPMECVARDVKRETAGRGWSLEDAARRVRYEALRDIARRHGATRLALAHTADDQAETVLMRLIRGAGLTGLTGIPRTRPLQEIVVIRPLLGFWRSELLAYLAHHQLTYCEDPTNRDPAFLRNRIRAQLLPVLEREYNPHIKALCCQLAEQCQVDHAYLQAAATRYWKRLVKRRGHTLLIRREGLARQPEAIQRSLVRLAIQQVQGDLNGFEFRHWRQIHRLTTDQPVGAVVDLPGALQLQRTRDHVVVRLKADPSSSPGVRRGLSSGFRPTGAAEGTPGLPGGLHRSMPLPPSRNHGILHDRHKDDS